MQRYRTTGALGNPVAFIITDNDIKNEIFLDYINQILSSGEIPNLLPKEELDMLISLFAIDHSVTFHIDI